ncbi:hypothetical protein LG634_13360 [Streptomyces bambusae]|uniref:hypothetical protein n=1 Tax=Streptomyces bambusae TaxID=1550616 RepID=UPI001CFDA61D|nr:hypothetical protein [Streptomyces bambusae]MCB5165818.1 hypothetical protein [Streptomyces bambusae]
MSGTFVVLAGPGDGGAAAVTRALAARVGGARVLAVTPGGLARARWTHRIDTRGEASTTVVLPTGTVLADGTVGAVLNRSAGLPYPAPARGAVGGAAAAAARAKDAAYAHTERQALLASWLLSLAPRVVGVTSAFGTVHGTVSPVAALVHAERCGLPVARRGGATRGGLAPAAGPAERHVPRLAWPGGTGSPVPVDVLPEAPPAGPRNRLLVAGGRVIGPRTGSPGLAGPAGPADVGERCRQLAAALGTPLFELRLAPAADTAVVTDVDLCPPLDDVRHVEAVADLLTALAAAPRTGRPS